MPMSEKLLELKLNPSAGQMSGRFTEGMPVAEAIGLLVAFQVDGKEGERLRRYGLVTAVHDNLLNIENNNKSSEQVVDTTIYFHHAAPLTIVWRQTAVAVADIAEVKEDK